MNSEQTAGSSLIDFSNFGMDATRDTGRLEQLREQAFVTFAKGKIMHDDRIVWGTINDRKVQQKGVSK
jgi:hypothetical protein